MCDIERWFFWIGFQSVLVANFCGQPAEMTTPESSSQSRYKALSLTHHVCVLLCCSKPHSTLYDPWQWGLFAYKSPKARGLQADEYYNVWKATTREDVHKACQPIMSVSWRNPRCPTKVEQEVSFGGSSVRPLWQMMIKPGSDGYSSVSNHRLVRRWCLHVSEPFRSALLFIWGGHNVTTSCLIEVLYVFGFKDENDANV